MVQQISYMKRKNLGNYEHEEVTLQAVFEEGEDYLEGVAKIKHAARQALDMVVNAEPVGETNEPKEEKKTTKKKATVTKKTTKKKAKAKSESESVADAKLDEEGSGEDAGNNEYELSDVKKALAKVWKTKGENIAKDIVKSFGVSRSDELSEDQFGAVIEECERCLK